MTVTRRFGGRTFDRRPTTDPRNRGYVHKPRKAVAPGHKKWTPIRVLDQGDVGGCVGWAWAGALSALKDMGHPARERAARNEFAKAMYMLATDLDEYEGEYPTEDTGSSTLGGAKAAQSLGYVGAYEWCYTAHDVYQAVMQSGPVVLGTIWYQSMMETVGGYILVNPKSGVAGGHEWFIYETFTNGDLGMQNSWGEEGYGDGGRARITQKSLDILLQNDGDACVPHKAVF